MIQSSGLVPVIQFPLQGGQAQVVVSKDRNPSVWFSVTPDGKELVTSLFRTGAAGSGHDFGFLSLETGQARKQVQIPPDAAGAFLSPDGQSIVFFRRELGVNNLWRQPIDSDTPSRISDFHLVRSISQAILDYAWSPNGKRFGLVRRFAKGNAVILQEQTK